MCQVSTPGRKRKAPPSDVGVQVASGGGPSKRERTWSPMKPPASLDGVEAGAAAPVPAPDVDVGVGPDLASGSLAAYEAFVSRWGLDDDENGQIVYQVYSDLRLIRKWSALRVDLIDFAVAGAEGVGVEGGGSGKRGVIRGIAPAATDAVYAGARARSVVPVGVSEQLKVGQLHDLCERAGIASGERCVTMAIVDDDSTTAYYRMFTRWEEITSTHWKQKKERAGEEDADGDGDGDNDDEDDDGEDSSE